MTSDFPWPALALARDRGGPPRVPFLLGDASGRPAGPVLGSVAVGHLPLLDAWPDAFALDGEAVVLRLAPALRELADIGIDGVRTHVLEPTMALEATYRRATWQEFEQARAAGELIVLDVRQRDEWDAGHLVEAIHLPLQDVETGAAALPPGEIWVHCKSGYRAGIAASLLQRLGRAVVHVDDPWEQVAELDLPTATAA